MTLRPNEPLADASKSSLPSAACGRRWREAPDGGALAIVLCLSACVSPDELAAASTDTGRDSGVAESERALPIVPDAEDLDPAENAVRISLVAGLLQHSIGGQVVDGFGYNGMSPGPTIRANVGDTVTVEFVNSLDEPTTVHWHGLSVPNDMDGAAWVDAPVPAQAGFTYQFVVDAPGTFWYHPHLDVSRQVDLGLYGAIVVRDPAEPEAEHDLVLLVDAWAEYDENDPDHHQLPPDPNTVVWTLNGSVEPTFTLGEGESARFRVINVSNTSYLSLDWPGARLIAGDQGLMGASTAAESVLLAPGNRREFHVLAPAPLSTTMWTAAGGEAFGEARTLLGVEGSGEGASLDWPFLGVGPSLNPDFADLVYVFSGGGGQGDWLINGEAWPAVTTNTLSLDQTAILEVRNLSETHHPFHLHGHRFEVLSTDGVAPPFATWADTIDVGIRSTVRLRLVADNPGDWLVHCHLLGHEDNGMMGLLSVE